MYFKVIREKNYFHFRNNNRLLPLPLPLRITEKKETFWSNSKETTWNIIFVWNWKQLINNLPLSESCASSESRSSESSGSSLSEVTLSTTTAFADVALRTLFFSAVAVLEGVMDFRGEIAVPDVDSMRFLRADRVCSGLGSPGLRIHQLENWLIHDFTQFSSLI